VREFELVVMRHLADIAAGQAMSGDDAVTVALALAWLQGQKP
jgi:hypothetical protein